MNTTHLSLFFYDNPDPKIFFIQDVSVYNPDLPVAHPYISITPPNFSTSYLLEYPVHSLIPVNSNAFGWTNTMDYNSLSVLQDGHYKIEQSVEPNCAIKRKYNYFRITSLKSSLMNQVAELFELNKSCYDCSNNEQDYKQLFFNIQWLEQAKFMAEQCGKIEEAKAIYNKVKDDCSTPSC